MSKRFVTGLVLSLALAAPAAAQQRPLVTEDPETIGSGLILFEGGFDSAARSLSRCRACTGDLLRLPTLGLSFGVELDRRAADRRRPLQPAQCQRARTRRRCRACSISPATRPATSRTSSSATKVRLLSETAGRPAIGVRFATKLPNASNENGIGLDTTDFYASLLMGKTVQSVRIVGNAGLGILGDPTRGDRQGDVLTYGFSVARAVRQGVGNRRRDQRPPADARRRDRAAGKRHPRRDARRRPVHASDSAIRRRHHPRHDLAGPKLWLHSRRDLGVSRIHGAVGRFPLPSPCLILSL